LVSFYANRNTFDDKDQFDEKVDEYLDDADFDADYENLEDADWFETTDPNSIVVKTEHIGGGIHDGEEYDLEFNHVIDFENLTEEELLALGGFTGKDILNDEDVEFETFDSDLFNAAIESSMYNGQDDYKEEYYEGEEEEIELGGGDVMDPTDEKPEEFYD